MRGRISSEAEASLWLTGELVLPTLLLIFMGDLDGRRKGKVGREEMVVDNAGGDNLCMKRLATRECLTMECKVCPKKSARVHPSTY